MAGFEVVVRPMVLPNIRPAPVRVLPPQDDPAQGICVIGGSGGGLIDLPYTFSANYSSHAETVETARQFDKVRVHQMDDKGNVNRNNFVDVERLTKVRLEEGGEPPLKIIFGEPPPEKNVETLEKDVTR